ncbi:MAG: dihydropteroate synthase [Solirubrobacterales bacterium]|nr:dihydropteroate synthase [Solirubrobacterales bacterium]
MTRRAPNRLLRTSAGTFELGGRPWLMGIVNATPDSFSDDGRHGTIEQRVELGRSMCTSGAAVIDVGGESGTTGVPPVSADEEIERVVPVIERLSAQVQVPISVDTYKPAVAHAAIAAGASIINDVSGLRDPELADVCASTGAALVLMHTRAAPKVKEFDPSLDGRALEDVLGSLRDRIELAVGRGVAFEQLVVDPGPDFGKTPAQSVEVLRELGELHALERPLLLAVSRKDFIGAITGRGPRERLAGTLAAVGHGVDAGAHILRVHDVAEVAQYLRVEEVLHGLVDVDPELRIADELRTESAKAPPSPDR